MKQQVTNMTIKELQKEIIPDGEFQVEANLLLEAGALVLIYDEHDNPKEITVSQLLEFFDRAVEEIEGVFSGLRPEHANKFPCTNFMSLNPILKSKVLFEVCEALERYDSQLHEKVTIYPSLEFMSLTKKDVEAPPIKELPKEENAVKQPVVKMTIKELQYEAIPPGENQQSSNFLLTAGAFLFIFEDREKPKEVNMSQVQNFFSLTLEEIEDVFNGLAPEHPCKAFADYFLNLTTSKKQETLWQVQAGLQRYGTPPFENVVLCPPLGFYVLITDVLDLFERV